MHLRLFFAVLTVFTSSLGFAQAPAAASGAGSARRVLAVLPPSTTDAQANELGLLVQARALAVLQATGRFEEVHIKQLLASADREGIDATKLSDPRIYPRFAKLVGADLWVYSDLTKSEKGFTHSVSATDGKRTVKVELSLGNDASRAVVAGATAIAQTVAKLDGIQGFKSPPSQPNSNSDTAMKELGHCYAIVVRQPMGIDNPAVLDPTELEDAIASCERARAADPALLTARTAEALAQAILGRDQDAVKSLGPASDAAALEPDPLYWATRFWLVTRYQSNEAGQKVLEQALAKDPGFTLARGYLGELLDVLGDHLQATKVWRGYLEACPRDPFVASRLGRSLARQGQFDEALKVTNQALALDPTSREIRLQLASRDLDAGKDAEAIELLKVLAAEKGARAEVQLRLGWATLRAGKLDEAETMLNKAIAQASRPGEWRTKARAHYDLALVEAKRKRNDKAEQHLKAAYGLGLKMRELDPELVPIGEKLEKSDLAATPANAGASKDGGKSLKPVVKESSLFPIDGYGDPETTKSKPRPPDGLTLVHF